MPVALMRTSVLELRNTLQDGLQAGASDQTKARNAAALFVSAKRRFKEWPPNAMSGVCREPRREERHFSNRKEKGRGRSGGAPP